MEEPKLEEISAGDVELAGTQRRQLWKSWKVLLPALLVAGALVWAGLKYNVDKRALAGGVLLIGLVSNAFAWLLALLGAVPVIGPLIIKVLAIPVIWLINAIGSVVSFVAIRRGYTKDVLTYRGLTYALIVGIVMGYILGKLF
jgi:hypothetical protein